MDRPHILVSGRQLRDVIADIWRAVIKANNPPRTFQREGKIVTLYQDGSEPKLDIVTAERLYGMVLEVADYFRPTKEDGVLTHSYPQHDIIRSMVTAPPKELPIIEGVSSVPMFLPDGSLQAKDGYCEQTKTYYFGMREIEGVESSFSSGESATDRDGKVAGAVRFLREEVYANFPFAGELEFSHVLAALLLPFVRPLIKGATPIHLIEANGPGSGKTLLAEVNTAIATGTVPGLIAPAGDEEEMRKRITSFLSEGHCNIILDNVNKEINSGVLASAITGEKWQDRPLYGSRIVTLPNRATWQITANNPRLSLEVARRCIRIRLLGNERPWERQEAAYKHPQLLKWVLDNRKVLIGHIATIVQNWFSSGCPRPQRTLGSFESWSAVIGGILESGGVGGFLSNCVDLYSDSDPETQEWEEAVEAWWASYGDKWISPTELEGLCFERHLLPNTRGGGTDQSRVIRLGIALGRLRDSFVGGHKILRRKDPSTKTVLYQLTGQKQQKIQGTE